MLVILEDIDQLAELEECVFGAAGLGFGILEGLGERGPPAANRDLDGNVTVGGLIQYVSEMVPRLTDTFHRDRQEVVQSASGQDFPLVSPGEAGP